VFRLRLAWCCRVVSPTSKTRSLVPWPAQNSFIRLLYCECSIRPEPYRVFVRQSWSLPHVTQMPYAALGVDIDSVLCERFVRLVKLERILQLCNASRSQLRRTIELQNPRFSRHRRKKTPLQRHDFIAGFADFARPLRVGSGSNEDDDWSISRRVRASLTPGIRSVPLAMIIWMCFSLVPIISVWARKLAALARLTFSRLRCNSPAPDRAFQTRANFC